jgi:hypothetical protein
MKRPLDGKGKKHKILYKKSDVGGPGKDRLWDGQIQRE